MFVFNIVPATLNKRHSMYVLFPIGSALPSSSIARRYRQIGDIILMTGELQFFTSDPRDGFCVNELMWKKFPTYEVCLSEFFADSSKWRGLVMSSHSKHVNLKSVPQVELVLCFSFEIDM